MSDLKEVVIDFEFNKPSNLDMGIVCVSFQERNCPKVSYWLRDDKGRADAKAHLETYKGHVLIAFAVELAESRCVNALGINPMDYKWRDLMVEVRWLRNQDDKYSYGRVVRDMGGFRTIQMSCPPIAKTAKKATKLEKDKATSQNFAYARSRGFSSIAPAGGSLLECLVYFNIIKTQAELNEGWERKQDVRNYIIAGVDIEARKEEILEYCESDIHYMFPLADAIRACIEDELKKPCIVFNPARNAALNKPPLFRESHAPFSFGDVVLTIGKWCAYNGYISCKGLPLDPERCLQIQKKAPEILDQLKLDFNARHWQRYRVEEKGVDDFKPIDHNN